MIFLIILNRIQFLRSISLVGENDRWLVKEIVKSSVLPVKCRLIPPEVIEAYRTRVGDLRGDVKEKLREEEIERELEETELDVIKNFFLILRSQNKLEAKYVHKGENHIRT